MSSLIDLSWWDRVSALNGRWWCGFLILFVRFLGDVGVGVGVDGDVDVGDLGGFHVDGIGDLCF